jgi:HAD superfamily hydrolase (TIGR01509 family)
MSRPPKAILFGAIGTLAETSELQRRAFNAAFRDAGLDWTWGRAAYRELLREPGGRARIVRYAETMGEEVDADRIHRAKVAYFRELAAEGLEPRPGVMEVIEQAREQGVRLAFATTTGTATVDLIFEGLTEHLSRDVFDFVGDRDKVSRPKPSSEIYRLALSEFGLVPGEALAIEDTPESAAAAVSARVPCIGFPGEAARDRSFPEGVLHVVDHLKPGLCGLRAIAA